MDERCEGGLGVHDPIWWSFGMSVDGEGEFLAFGDVVPCGHDSFGSGIREAVASDVCVSSDFA